MQVARVVKQDALCGHAVAPGAAGLLIIAFQVLGHVVMDHEAHVGFVNAHAECVGGDDDAHAVEQERLLVCAARFLGKACVVRRGGDALLR